MVGSNATSSKEAWQIKDYRLEEDDGQFKGMCNAYISAYTNSTRGVKLSEFDLLIIHNDLGKSEAENILVTERQLVYLLKRLKR